MLVSNKNINTGIRTNAEIVVSMRFPIRFETGRKSVILDFSENYGDLFRQPGGNRDRPGRRVRRSSRHAAGPARKSAAARSAAPTNRLPPPARPVRKSPGPPLTNAVTARA